MSYTFNSLVLLTCGSRPVSIKNDAIRSVRVWNQWFDRNKTRRRDVVWVPIPEPYCRLGSMKFAIHMMEHANVAVPWNRLPTSGKGHPPGWRWWKKDIDIGQALRQMRRALPALTDEPDISDTSGR